MDPDFVDEFPYSGIECDALVDEDWDDEAVEVERVLYEDREYLS